MCYSAMIEQDAKELSRKFNAKMNIDHYAQLFKKRLDGEKLYINKAMEVPFLNSASSMLEKSVGKSIRQWHESEVTRLTAELKKQQDRLEHAVDSLKKKETKKALEDQRIATNKISKCKFDLKLHESEKVESDLERRIYPLHYMSVLCLDKKGEKTIIPMRYLMRPRNEGEDFDQSHFGCYNARFDSLTKVPFWRDSVENRRGIIVVNKFYENVPTKNYPDQKKLSAEQKAKDNLVICFEPKGMDEMYIPVVWDYWKKGKEELFSAALITDDPAPEVKAAGHDRTPIFLKASAIDGWLHAKGKAKDIKELALSARETPFYQHKVLGVAS